MRLLKQSNDGEVSLTEDLIDNIPPYAILSHTWGPDTEEISFRDLTEGTRKSKTSYDKIKFCGEQAKRDGLKYFWVDTCCIDKANHIELTKAINSMFAWYRNAERCYVYLSDVSRTALDTHDKSNQLPWESSFKKSKWFTRGWTLQELLAPSSVEFFSREGKRVGEKTSLEQQIHEVTNIPLPALRGTHLSNFTVEDRMSWAATRSTTRSEDWVYSLLGIFDVSMPIIYGEGVEKATSRIQRQIEASEKEQVFQSRLPLTYLPLKHSGIRVLSLNPGVAGTEITADMEVFNLDEHESLKYNALSYVWGPEPAIHPIVINNETFLIRPNLFHALQRIRDRSECLKLWVDSVCIDQTNTLEKTEQVGRMADIFHKARNVWIWLGEEDSTSKTAMDFIPEIVHSAFKWNDLWWEQPGITA